MFAPPANIASLFGSGTGVAPVRIESARNDVFLSTLKISRCKSCELCKSRGFDHRAMPTLDCAGTTALSGRETRLRRALRISLELRLVKLSQLSQLSHTPLSLTPRFSAVH